METVTVITEVKPRPAFDNLMKAINDANLTPTERLDIMMALAEYITSTYP